MGSSGRGGRGGHHTPASLAWQGVPRQCVGWRPYREDGHRVMVPLTGWPITHFTMSATVRNEDLDFPHAPKALLQPLLHKHANQCQATMHAWTRVCLGQFLGPNLAHVAWTYMHSNACRFLDERARLLCSARGADSPSSPAAPFGSQLSDEQNSPLASSQFRFYPRVSGDSEYVICEASLRLKDARYRCIRYGDLWFRGSLCSD